LNTDLVSDSKADERLIQVLAKYGLADSQVERFGTGLINDTFLVSAGIEQQFVLQRLNPLFTPEINRDIDALTQHLFVKNVSTQRLIPADNGKLWVEDEGYAWRMATFMPGVCLDMLATDTQAAAAGDLLARFHRDVRDLKIDLHGKRLGVHDTSYHLQELKNALTEHSEHRNFKAINVLAQEIFSQAEQLPELPLLIDRLVHGDPKISNLVFDASSGNGICMIDLDTLAYMPLPLELGDAFRSWCNPRGEDTQRSEFRLDFFAAAVNAYAKVADSFLFSQEWQNFISATRIIMIELAARFATDALRECYFGWNPDKFADRSAHNQVRAAGQLELHRSLYEKQDEAEKIVFNAFTSI
jgi:Ser/Thr protein kinase RdoA (MazF antagonist)